MNGNIPARESEKAKRVRMAAIVERLKEVYPDAACALQFEGEPWKLLVMGRLSAQCTDARVNIVCKELFRRFPTAQDMAEGDLSEIEDCIKSCGLYHSKAANIKDACRMLVDSYGGVLPDNMDELLKFPGVGRKIANLLLGDIYGKPAIVADTHCMRLSVRMGFCPKGKKMPEYVEKALSKIVEPHEQSDLCHRLVQFGRDWCPSRGVPGGEMCEQCPLAALCKQVNEKA